MPPRPAAPPPPPEPTQVIRTEKGPEGPAEPKPEGPVDIFELAGVGDPLTADPSALWQRREDRYRVPLGVGEDGQPVLLDLLRSGAALGVFGSSSPDRPPFLHSLLFGMAATHSPEEIALVCAGGPSSAPTWNSITRLPHTAAVQTLTGGSRDQHRITTALEGELERRARLLATLSTQHHTDYQAVQPQTQLDPMPLLVVAIDRLPQFLADARPFQHTLQRLASSEHLGIKLLFSADAPHQVSADLVRGCGSVVLHTCDESDARVFLDVHDANELQPDEACLRTSRRGERVRFRTAHADLPHASSPPDSPVPSYRYFADRVAHQARPARTLLPTPPDAEPPAGVDAPSPASGEDRTGTASPLTVTVGIVDNPREHRQDPLRLDFAASDTTLAIVGRPRSGKTSAVLTTLLALALSTSPTDVRFHCLAFGGNRLLPLRDLPHSSAVVASCDREEVEHVLAQLESTLDRRLRRFAAEGIESAADFRRRRAESDLGEEATDHVLVVDGWPEVHQHPGLADRVLRLARRGPEHGIHLVVTANRWDDLPRELRELTGGRIELRLTDPRESVFSAEAAERIPDEPGHCLHRGLWGLVHLPVPNDALPSYVEHVEHGLPDDLSAATRALIARIGESWQVRPGDEPAPAEDGA